jgi:hypothetical protein
MAAMVAAMMLSGYAILLDKQMRDAPTWGEGMFMAAALGLLYATFWPLVGRRA